MYVKNILILFLSLLVALTCGCQSADPKAKLLAKNIPVISLKDNSIKSFKADLEARFHEISFNAFMTAKTPGLYTMKQTDLQGRPFLFGTGGEFVLYNPIENSLILFHGKPFGEINIKRKVLRQTQWNRY